MRFKILSCVCSELSKTRLISDKNPKQKRFFLFFATREKSFFTSRSFFLIFLKHLLLVIRERLVERDVQHVLQDVHGAFYREKKGREARVLFLLRFFFEEDDVFFFPDFPSFSTSSSSSSIFINFLFFLSLFKNKVEHVRVRGRDHRRRFSRGENGQ